MKSTTVSRSLVVDFVVDSWLIAFSLEDFVVDFWCFVLIGTTGYTTNVIEKHLHMPLQNDHFDHWINLFNQTLDELFVGENAETAKQRALVIAWTTKSKLNLN